MMFLGQTSARPALAYPSPNPSPLVPQHSPTPTPDVPPLSPMLSLTMLATP